MQGRRRTSKVALPAKRKNNTGRFTVEDEREMWDLYTDGHPQADIAGRFGISQQRVGQILARLGEQFPQPDKDEFVLAFTTHLQQAIVALMPRVRRGDDTAIRTLVKVQERACRMLGLDKQQVRELTANAAGEPVHYILEGDADMLEALE
jgi:hypothetical protein